MKKFLFFVTISVLILSCGKEPIEPEIKSGDNHLTGLTFESKLNSSLKISARAVKGDAEDQMVYITVPEGVSLTNLVPTFDIHSKASIKINDKPFENGVTPVNFTNVVVVSIVAENDIIRNYFVCAKNGNSTIDKMVYEFMVEYDIPGLSLTVSKGEELEYSYGYGVADKETHERVTPKHLFRVASVTKPQTAIAIMLLYEQGKIDLDAKVFGADGILKDKFGGDYGEKKMSVTVRNLLEHTSGWKSNPDPVFTTNSAFAGKSLEHRISYVLENVDQTDSPGTKYNYYNLGYGVLGLIIEHISGKDYETFMREEVYSKMGVEDIYVGKDRNDRRSNEVVYYSQSGTNGYANDMYMIRALGGLIASTEELAQVLNSVDYGTKVPDILKSETLDVMYAPSTAYNRYGLGWRMNHGAFTNWASYHSGNLSGTAALWERGKNSVHAIMLCNSRSYKDNFDNDQYILLYNIESSF